MQLISRCAHAQFRAFAGHTCTCTQFFSSCFIVGRVSCPSKHMCLCVHVYIISNELCLYYMEGHAPSGGTRPTRVSTCVRVPKCAGPFFGARSRLRIMSSQGPPPLDVHICSSDRVASDRDPLQGSMVMVCEMKHYEHNH